MLSDNCHSGVHEAKPSTDSALSARSLLVQAKQAPPRNSSWYIQVAASLLASVFQATSIRPANWYRPAHTTMSMSPLSPVARYAQKDAVNTRAPDSPPTLSAYSQLLLL